MIHAVLDVKAEELYPIDSSIDLRQTSITHISGKERK